MYLPDPQKLIAGGLAIAASANQLLGGGKSVSKGSVLDYAVEKCLDSDGNIRCTKPFAVKADGCYTLEWSTEGALSHTTIEVRDAGSGEMVYYRDTNGEWKPEKNELVYLDFKPKIWKTGNDTVEYEVKTCEKKDEDL